ncbi:MAG: S8 family serine peptidase, partial [Bacteroidota bacterium]
FSPEMDFFGQDPISTNYGGPWPGNGVDNGAGCFPDDYYGYDFFHDDNNPSDRKGHGTHMAYTILTANQPNQKPVRIMPLQFGGYREDEFSCDLFSGICAINYATKTKEDMKVDVMNLSWGFYSRIFHDVLYEQMLKTQEAEIVVVTSAGNDFVLVDNCYHWPSGYSQVEELENVISVAALAYFNSPDDYALSSYSNYGMDVDLAAPGTEILGALVGTFNDKTRLDGTSMAAAVVSRRIAMLRYDQQNGMPIPAKELKQLLLTQETRLLDRACIDGRRMLDPLIDPTLLDAIGY